jgi:sugar/nucleoside kinase (ribokinase family)
MTKTVKATQYRIHLTGGDMVRDTKKEAFRQARNIARASGSPVLVTPEPRPRFKVGERFRLSAGARIEWITVKTYTDGELVAARLDNEIGLAILAWVAAGREGANRPNPGQVSSVSRRFADSELEGAVRTDAN